MRGGGLCLARAAQYLCPGVVLAVVDPGVGTERRAVAVEVGEGASVLVGPDNGLLAPAVALVGGASRVVELTNPAYQLAAPGFDLRRAVTSSPPRPPTCALGCRSTSWARRSTQPACGPGTLPLTRIEGDRLHAEVLWVDRYGNAQLNVDPDELADYGEAVALQVGGSVRVARRARTYAELRTGEIGLVVDSYGLVSVAVDRSSAADELRIGAGDPLSLAPLPDADARDVAADADTHTHQGADSGHDAGGAPGRVPDRRNGTATAVRLSSRPTGPRRA